MRSVVTRVFKSSMEIYVFVDSENLVTGKRTFTNEAFFSMVALQPSPSLQPITVPLPRLIAESELEVALSEAGERRRIKRLQQRRELAERELAEREARLLAQPPAVEQPNAMEYIKLHVNITNS
ncbi:hypothetical protein BX616_004305 [Lobosporangium transversale]|nr:hypothetical protein BX616_004305 [Lobosporangium transversale]